MKGWTSGVLRRDMQEWPYAHLLSDQNGEVIVETVHKSLSSLRVEVKASASRIAEGKPNRGGQIPTSIDVLGAAPSLWREWMETVNLN